MKPRKVNLSLEITTDLSIGVLRKTRSAHLLGDRLTSVGVVEVQQASAYVIQPVPTAKPKGFRLESVGDLLAPKKGAKKK